MIRLLLAALVIVPVLEIYVVIQVGEVIGVGWTVVALVAESVLGAWLVRREGRRAWRTLVGELTGGGLTGAALASGATADGAVLLLGGVLLLTPGFITDLFGFLCVLPFTRPLFRRALVGLVARRYAPAGGGFGPTQQFGTIEGRVVDRPDGFG